MANRLKRRPLQLPAEILALEEELTRDEAVDGSARLLLDRLTTEIEKNKADPVALQGIINRWRAANTLLGAAVAANTPADPGTTPVEPGGGADVPPAEEPTDSLDEPVTSRRGGSRG